jgi:hypothetical protein
MCHGLLATRDDLQLARGVRGETALTVPADGAVLLVLAPAGGRVTRDGAKMLIDDVVVDYYQDATRASGPF